MCVEGLSAIPLGCSDCYDKDNILETSSWQARQSRLWWLGRGGAGAATQAGPGWLSPWHLAQHRLEEWQPSLEQLLFKHLGCCDRAVHHPGL